MRTIEVLPLVLERWKDFEILFGPKGACAGCWCMFWKLARRDFVQGQGESNRLAQKEIVQSGCVPGLIAYVDGIPVGWMAIEPRESYQLLSTSRILKALDALPVWSITCFFIAKEHRHQGLTALLLAAGIKYVADQGGEVIEGYPIEPRKSGTMSPAFIYTGLASTFKKAGFIEAARRSETRPIMRFNVRKRN